LIPVKKNIVMAALVAAIHFPETNVPCSWMAGTGPAMTEGGFGFSGEN